MDYFQKSIKVHKKFQGKLETKLKFPLKDKSDLSIAYTPGVAEVSREVAKDKTKLRELSMMGNAVAVISNGTAVLGLGDIGPEGAYPVMEGKAVLFKHFANIDAYPIVLAEKDPDKIVDTIIRIAPGFAGINLEDISAPWCFEIEKRLVDSLKIPVFHDDQHGTAIVVLAGLINATRALNRDLKQQKVVINGAGAAGIAVGTLLKKYGIKDITFCDSKGIISKSRNDLNESKKELLVWSNKSNDSGDLRVALKDKDIFVGLSIGNLLKVSDVQLMNKDSIIFAMANPIPEIMPDDAKKGGAAIVATGRSDYSNQINNVLVFPGIFRGALDNKVTKITDEMKLNAAQNLAMVVKAPTVDMIIPSPFDSHVVQAVARAVK